MHLWVKMPVNECQGLWGVETRTSGFAVKQHPTSYLCLLSGASREHSGARGAVTALMEMCAEFSVEHCQVGVCTHVLA